MAVEPLAVPLRDPTAESVLRPMESEEPVRLSVPLIAHLRTQWEEGRIRPRKMALMQLFVQYAEQASG